MEEEKRGCPSLKRVQGGGDRAPTRRCTFRWRVLTMVGEDSRLLFEMGWVGGVAKRV